MGLKHAIRSLGDLNSGANVHLILGTEGCTQHVRRVERRGRLYYSLEQACQSLEIISTKKTKYCLKRALLVC